MAGWVWDSFGPAHAFGLSAVACIFGYFSIRQSSRMVWTPVATTSSASGVLDKK